MIYFLLDRQTAADPKPVGSPSGAIPKLTPDANSKTSLSEGGTSRAIVALRGVAWRSVAWRFWSDPVCVSEG